MKCRWIISTLLIACCAASNVFGQGFTERGATVGGIAGALGGAAIGKHNDKTGIGALIGGAVGLATGAAIGSAKDEQLARERAIQQQYLAQVASGVGTQDVVTMTRNGVSDSVIISHIQQNGVQRRLEVSDIIALHQQGVSESVITALERAPLASAPVQVVAPRPAPVVVEEHYYARPVYVYPRPYYYHPPHYHHHHGVGTRVTFGF